MTAEAFKDYLAQLGADYRRELPARLAHLDTLWHAVVSGNGARVASDELKRELHTLVGTARTMGLPAVTAAARALESHLEPVFAQGGAPDVEMQANTTALFGALKRSVDE